MTERKYVACSKCQNYVGSGIDHTGESHGAYCKEYSFIDGVWICTLLTARIFCPTVVKEKQAKNHHPFRPTVIFRGGKK